MNNDMNNNILEMIQKYHSYIKNTKPKQLGTVDELIDNFIKFCFSQYNFEIDQETQQWLKSHYHQLIPKWVDDNQLLKYMYSFNIQNVLCLSSHINSKYIINNCEKIYERSSDYDLDEIEEEEEVNYENIKKSCLFYNKDQNIYFIVYRYYKKGSYDAYYLCYDLEILNCNTKEEALNTINELII